MKTKLAIVWTLFFSLWAVPVFAEDADLAKRIDDIMKKCAAHDNYHITAGQLYEWMKAGKNDFMVVDIRFSPDDGQWGQPKYGRIPGSVFIPYYDLFEPKSLAKLQKNKKIILVDHMGVHENYSVVPLKLLGYDAYALLMGMSGWQKDYPAVGHVNMLIHAPDNVSFPLEKEAEGSVMHHKHQGR